jgi:choline kinase
VLQPEGEALGINFFAKKDLFNFKHHLTACQSKDYFEKGIEYGIQQGQVVWSCVVEAMDCAEIDFPEDLVRANELLKKW